MLKGTVRKALRESLHIYANEIFDGEKVNLATIERFETLTTDSEIIYTHKDRVVIDIDTVSELIHESCATESEVRSAAETVLRIAKEYYDSPKGMKSNEFMHIKSTTMVDPFDIASNIVVMWHCHDLSSRESLMDYIDLVGRNGRINKARRILTNAALIGLGFTAGYAYFTYKSGN